jgi:hypothetical protein
MVERAARAARGEPFGELAPKLHAVRVGEADGGPHPPAHEIEPVRARAPERLRALPRLVVVHRARRRRLLCLHAERARERGPGARAVARDARVDIARRPDVESAARKAQHVHSTAHFFFFFFLFCCCSFSFFLFFFFFVFFSFLFFCFLFFFVFFLLFLFFFFFLLFFIFFIFFLFFSFLRCGIWGRCFLFSKKKTRVSNPKPKRIKKTKRTKKTPKKTPKPPKNAGALAVEDGGAPGVPVPLRGIGNDDGRRGVPHGHGHEQRVAREPALLGRARVRRDGGTYAR